MFSVWKIINTLRPHFSSFFPLYFLNLKDRERGPILWLTHQLPTVGKVDWTWSWNTIQIVHLDGRNPRT